MRQLTYPCPIYDVLATKSPWEFSRLSLPSRLINFILSIQISSGKSTFSFWERWMLPIRGLRPNLMKIPRRSPQDWTKRPFTVMSRLNLVRIEVDLRVGKRRRKLVHVVRTGPFRQLMGKELGVIGRQGHWRSTLRAPSLEHSLNLGTVWAQKNASEDALIL
jgi:hypothetical protein